MSAQIASQQDVPSEIGFLRDKLFPVATVHSGLETKIFCSKVGFLYFKWKKMICGGCKNIIYPDNDVTRENSSLYLSFYLFLC